MLFKTPVTGETPAGVIKPQLKLNRMAETLVVEEKKKKTRSN